MIPCAALSNTNNDTDMSKEPVSCSSYKHGNATGCDDNEE